jgi:hypothetical protein
MDVLSLLVQRASEEGLLQPLSARQLHHRILIYADDTVIFLRPDPRDINLVLDLLRLFGTASGLKTNVQKKSVVPIRCDDQILNAVKELLSCDFVGFPCKYLGLPLSLTRLTKSQIQNIIDRLSSLLPWWKSELMNRAGFFSSRRGLTKLWPSIRGAFFGEAAKRQRVDTVFWLGPRLPAHRSLGVWAFMICKSWVVH